jgi:hypothetical protein
LHAVAFGIAVATLILVRVRSGGGGTSWLVYLVLALWALVLALYCRGLGAARRRTYLRAAVPDRMACRQVNEHLVPRM